MKPPEPRGFGVDLGKQRLHGARRWRAKRLVEMDGLRQFLAHQFVAAGEFGIGGERGFDALRVARAQRAGGVPGQQIFDLAAFALRSPCSWPTSINPPLLKELR